jgi:hypothetical protein
VPAPASTINGPSPHSTAERCSVVSSIPVSPTADSLSAITISAKAKGLPCHLVRHAAEGQQHDSIATWIASRTQCRHDLPRGERKRRGNDVSSRAKSTAIGVRCQHDDHEPIDASVT